MAKRDKRRAAGQKAKVKRREERQRKDARQAARDPFQNAWRLPLCDCLVNRRWRESRLASLVVSRERHDGSLAVAGGLVDLGCLGLKDGWLSDHADPEAYERILDRMESEHDPFVPCDLELARAILVRGVAHAAALGFEPHRTYPQVLQVLGPPAEGEALPEVTCGKDGKPFYVAGPRDDVEAIVAALRQRCGPDGFHFIAPLGGDPEPDDAIEVIDEHLARLAARRDHGQEAMLRRCGELKRCLVLWAGSEELAEDLERFSERPTHGDEETEADLLDSFIAYHRLPDECSLHESFIARFPQLGEDDRAIVLGWRDSVDGMFEITAHAGDHLVLENLVDELRYETRSSMGRTGLDQVPREGFLLGRVSRFGDGWLLSGEHRYFPASAADILCASAAQIALRDPRAFFRNPRHLELGWEHQRRKHEAFVAHFGSDLVIVPGPELRAVMDGFSAAWVAQARAQAVRNGVAVIEPEEVPRIPLPAGFLSEPEVAVLDHPVWGQGLYLGFRALAAAYEDPHAALRADGVGVVLDFLDDDDLDPLPLVLLGGRHPEAASVLFSAILGRPGFDWTRDGDALLRERKPRHFARLLPRVLPLSDRLAGAVRRVGPLPTP